MKINVNTELTNVITDEPLTIDVELQEDSNRKHPLTGEPLPKIEKRKVTIAVAVIEALRFRSPEDKNMTQEESFENYDILRMFKAATSAEDGVLELSTDECSHVLKRAVKRWAPDVYGQLHILLDGKKRKRD